MVTSVSSENLGLRSISSITSNMVIILVIDATGTGFREFFSHSTLRLFMSTTIPVPDQFFLLRNLVYGRWSALFTSSSVSGLPKFGLLLGTRRRLGAFPLLGSRSHQRVTFFGLFFLPSATLETGAFFPGTRSFSPGTGSVFSGMFSPFADLTCSVSFF